MHDGQIIEKCGFKFRVNIENDNDHCPPWEDDEGAGVVTDWVNRSKRPHELLLNANSRVKRFFDVKATTEKANEQGWGLTEEKRAELREKLGKEPTRKQVIAKAVDLEYKHLKAYCDDDWYYVGVIVTQIFTGKEKLDYANACWGFESKDEQGIKECAEDFMNQVIAAERESARHELTTCEALLESTSKRLADLQPAMHDLTLSTLSFPWYEAVFELVVSEILKLKNQHASTVSRAVDLKLTLEKLCPSESPTL